MMYGFLKIIKCKHCETPIALKYFYFLLVLILLASCVDQELFNNIERVDIYWYTNPTLALNKEILFQFTSKYDIDQISQVLKTLKPTLLTPKIASVEGYYFLKILYKNGNGVTFEINHSKNIYLVEKNQSFESNELMLFIHAYVFDKIIDYANENKY